MSDIPLAATAFWAASFTAFQLFLAVQVIRSRRASKIAWGTYGPDGEDATVLRTMRGHANFLEFVPITLILMAIAEINGASVWLVHAIGLTLMIGRALHAHHALSAVFVGRSRVLGMSLSFTAQVAGAALVFAQSLGLL